MESNSKVAVLIPIYKVSPDQDEIFSIKNTVEKMDGFPCFFVAPKGLDLGAYVFLSVVKTEFFPKRYFKNIYGYNCLMLSVFFYKRFLDYEYILIVQPDAILFRDGKYLEKFLDGKNYDYWGAPWKRPFSSCNFNFHLYHKWLKFFAPALHFFKKPERMCSVGNGGLTLRNVKKTITLLKSNFMHKTLWGAAEDCFFAFFGQENKVGFKLAPLEIADKFCWEERFNGNLHYEELPFGIHDWKHYFPELMDNWECLEKDKAFFLVPSRYKLGDVVNFCSGGFNATSYILSGFSNTEKYGAWTDSQKAILLVRFKDADFKSARAIHCKIELSDVWEGCKVVDIFVNNAFVAQKSCENKLIEFDFLCSNSVVLLCLKPLFTLKPQSFSLEDERRELGICIKSLCFTKGEAVNPLCLYGAGKVARSVLRRLRSADVEPAMCIVSDASKNSDTLLGVPIVGLDDVADKNVQVVVAVGRQFQDEVFAALKERGFESVALYSYYLNGLNK